MATLFDVSALTTLGAACVAQLVHSALLNIATGLLGHLACSVRKRSALSHRTSYRLLPVACGLSPTTKSFVINTRIGLGYNTAMRTPFCDTLIPLSIGLRRRQMLRAGASEQAIRLDGSYISYYHAPARRQLGRGQPSGQPAILLVHGIADNATTWAYVFHGLRHIGDVYAIDLPGFGHSLPPAGQSHVGVRSMTALIEAFIAQVIRRPVLLVGNSMGGWMGFRLALTHPDLLVGLVAINPGGAPLGGRASWQPFIELAQVPDLAAVRTIYRRMFARQAIRWPLYVGQHSFQRLFSCPAVQALLAETSEDDFLLADQICGLDLPTAIIWGAADGFLPTGSLEFFRSCLDHADWLMLPATGHLPQVERPRAVRRFVRRFAQKLPPPSPLAPSPLVASALPAYAPQHAPAEQATPA